MAGQATCHTCIYAHWDPGLWMRTLWSGFPARPTCSNQPDSPGRTKECPLHGICRNYRPKPPTPEGNHVKSIPLTNGFHAYVDAMDYEWLSRWHRRAYSTGYAGRYEKGKLVYMHRQIMQPPKGMIVDHINGNGFDNTRINLRNTTRRQNMYNRGKHVGTASIYKGVARDKRSGKWYAEIRSGNARPRSPLFAEEVEAARAYARMAIELFREYARLNLPQEWPPERRAQVHAKRAKTDGRVREKGVKDRSGRAKRKGKKVKGVGPGRTMHDARRRTGSRST